MSIGEVSDAAGASITTIRYYEEVGLLTPAGRASGRRRFETDALVRLRTIAVLKDAGFSLEEVRELITGGDGTVDRRRELVTRRLAEVRHGIRRLQAIEKALVDTIDCGCATVEHCEALAAKAEPLRSAGSRKPPTRSRPNIA